MANLKIAKTPKTKTAETPKTKTYQPGTVLRVRSPLHAVVLVRVGQTLTPTNYEGSLWTERLTRAAKLVVVEHTRTVGVVVKRQRQGYWQHYMIPSDNLVPAED